MIESSKIEIAMRRCLALANDAIDQGQYPLAAVVIDSAGVVAEAGSSLVSSVDPSGHPEVVAMRMAAKKLGSRYMPGAVLVSTMEPCPMCSAMAIWAKMEAIAYATPQEKAAEFGRQLRHPLFTFRQIHLKCSEVLARGEPKLMLYERVLEEEAFDLLRRLRNEIAPKN